MCVWKRMAGTSKIHWLHGPQTINNYNHCDMHAYCTFKVLLRIYTILECMYMYTHIRA